MNVGSRFRTVFFAFSHRPTFAILAISSTPTVLNQECHVAGTARRRPVAAECNDERRFRLRIGRRILLHRRHQRSDRGTSLITVPVMMQCGMDPHVAVATNMLALVFLSLGGTVPFIKGQAISRKRLPALTGLTLVGSTLGAFLLLAVPSRNMPIVVAAAMLVVLLFSLVKRDMGVSKAPDSSSRSLEIAGYIATFALGVYGGFFSGGYVALLTVAYVFFFRMTFTEAVAVTKVLNLFSSLIATASSLGRASSIGNSVFC